MELFLLPFPMDGAEEHAAGVNAHHGAGRQVRDGDAGFADQLLLSLGTEPSVSTL